MAMFLKSIETESKNCFNFRIPDFLFFIMDSLFPHSIFYAFNADKKVSNVVVENLQVHGKKIKFGISTIPFFDTIFWYFLLILKRILPG